MEPDDQPDRPVWLRVDQIAERLVVSADTVIAWIKRGELRGLLVSKSARSRRPQFRVTAADLETFVAGRLTHPPPTRPTHPRRTADRTDYERIV